MYKRQLQDIADKLNISRNTVSKALNNTGVISEETKNKVLQTAIEMGYKQFSYIQANSSSKEYLKNKEIALFTSNMPTGSHFEMCIRDRIYYVWIIFQKMKF